MVRVDQATSLRKQNRGRSHVRSGLHHGIAMTRAFVWRRYTQARAIA